ncbi:MAG: hypothetical protein U5J83_09910 [Bryobacterales bacterium]|nr:hypothetical protein [Bryobacterales bacterium]
MEAAFALQKKATPKLLAQLLFCHGKIAQRKPCGRLFRSKCIWHADRRDVLHLVLGISDLEVAIHGRLGAGRKSEKRKKERCGKQPLENQLVVHRIADYDTFSVSGGKAGSLLVPFPECQYRMKGNDAIPDAATVQSDH